MVSAGMTCVKYLLFFINLLFAISGIAVLTIGVLSYVLYVQYSKFVYPSFQVAPLIIIAAGVIIFVIAFLGCCGAVNENQCMINTFAGFLVLIFLLEIAVGITGYLCRNEVETLVEEKLNSTLFDYYKNDEIKHAWDITQHEGECCGITGPNDWKAVTKNDSLPHTCCPDRRNDGSCLISTPDHYTESCFGVVKDTFKRYAYILTGIGLGISLSQVIGIIFACCLARSISQEYEIV